MYKIKYCFKKQKDPALKIKLFFKKWNKVIEFRNLFGFYSAVTS